MFFYILYRWLDPEQIIYDEGGEKNQNLHYPQLYFCRRPKNYFTRPEKKYSCRTDE